MKYEGSRDTNSQKLMVSEQGHVVLPDNITLKNAQFEQSGSDLIVELEDGTRTVVENFFLMQPMPDFVMSNGIQLSGRFLSTLVGPLTPVQYSQAIPVNGTEPIGVVETASGLVEVVRADGTRVRLNTGDSVYEDDTIVTGGDSAIGITLADQSSLALGEEGRLVLDEMVYDPDAEDGGLSLSLTQGVFTFVSGQIAKTGPDAMVINTPVGTIGIRGTAGGLRVRGNDGETTVVLAEESGDFVGELVVSTQAGSVVLGKAGLATLIRSSTLDPDEPYSMPIADFGRVFGRALEVLPKGEILLDATSRNEALHAYEEALKSGEPVGEAVKNQEIDLGQLPESGEPQGEGIDPLRAGNDHLGHKYYYDN